MKTKIRLSVDPQGSSRFKRAVLALVTIASISSLPGATAQNTTVPGSTPSVAASASEVNEAGYSLKPTGLSTSEWPNLRLDFSIERSDHTPFRNLNLADVQPKVDGALLATTEGDLRLSDNQASSVLLLIDVSGSMSGSGVDKLRTAKEALKTLINNLGPADRVGLAAFDEEPRTIVSPTADKELLKKEIEGLSIRRGKSSFTNLYDAVYFGLSEARKNNIKNVLVISDGWEDTPRTRALLTSPDLDEYKRQREQRITEFSRANDIRVFTVAIGDEEGRGLNYVDRTALENISKGANGGVAAYIELKAFLGEDSLQESYLLSRLRQTLDELRRSFHHSYSLTLRPGQMMQRDNREHKLWIGFAVGDNPRIQLPIEYSLAWTTIGPPVVTGTAVQPAVFIQSAPRHVRWRQLLLIYLALLAVLATLALVPVVGRRLMGGGKAVRLHRAITSVGNRSPLLGKPCPNEGLNSGSRYLIKEGDVILTCPRCGTGHHLSCWRFNEHHCMNRTCEFEMVVPPKVLEKYGLMERELRSV